MKLIDFKQLTLSLLAILSLFASTVSACSCSHHQGKAEIQIDFSASSCHEHHPTKSETDDEAAAENFENASFSSESCVCYQTAPKVFAKAETIKVEKNSSIAAVTSALWKQNENVLIAIFIAPKIDFIKPFYLSDCFYNLSFGRAPPIL